MSASLIRSTGVTGSWSRCRARNRHVIPCVLTARLDRQVPVIGQLIQQRQHRRRRIPGVTAWARNPRTADSTALIRRAPRAGRAQGRVSTCAPGTASNPLTAAPAWRNHTMNKPKSVAPALRQSRPERAHHRRYNAIPPA